MRLMFYHDYSGKCIHYALVGAYEFSITTKICMYNGMTFRAIHLPDQNEEKLYEIAQQFSSHKEKTIEVLRYCHSRSGDQIYLNAIDEIEKYEK